MRKAILLFVVIFAVLGGMLVWFIFGDGFHDPKELLMLGGVALVLVFAAVLGIRRIQSVRKSQPPEDELSKSILKRSAGTAYHLSLYTWLALMFFSDDTQMEMSSYIGLGIMLMAVEFALAWVYHNYIARVHE